MIAPTTSISDIKTISGSKKVRTKLYAIYEGEKTECQYFEALQSQGLLVPYVEPVKIEKCGLDKHTTMREDLVKIANDEMTFIDTGINTFRRLLSYALSYTNIYDFKYLSSKVNSPKKKQSANRKTERNDNMRGYPAIRKYFRKELIDAGCIDDSDHVLDTALAIRTINKSLKKIDMDYRIENVDSLLRSGHLKHSTENKPYPREVWIIFDRDQGSITEEDFQNAIHNCESKGYFAIVSSPKFELWLSMHHPTFDYESPKISYDSKYGDILDDKLIELEDGTDIVIKIDNGVKKITRKGIGAIRFNKFYKNRLKYAIETSKNKMFQTNPSLMIRSPGTNVGINLERILK